MLDAVLLLLHEINNILPLGPLGIATGYAANQRHAGAVAVTKAAQAADGLLDADGAKLDDDLLHGADLPLQGAALAQLVFRQRRLLAQAKQLDHALGVEASAAVNGAHAADGHDGQQLLAQAREGGELGVVYRGVRRDLGVDRHVGVGQLAAHDVGVFGQRRKCRGHDLDVVRDAGVVVAGVGGLVIVAFPPFLLLVFRIDLHHDGDGTLVGDGCEPLDDAFLCARAGKVSRHQAETPLRAGVLCALELLDGVLDALRGGAGNDGVVLEAGLVVGLAHARENLEALLVGQVNGLASAAEHDESLDAGLGQVDGVSGLRLYVDGRCDGIVSGRGLWLEEGWHGDVDASGRRGGHGEDVNGKKVEDNKYVQDVVSRATSRKQEISTGAETTSWDGRTRGSLFLVRGADVRWSEGRDFGPVSSDA
jgi:hypothetical protein